MHRSILGIYGVIVPIQNIKSVIPVVFCQGLVRSPCVIVPCERGFIRRQFAPCIVVPDLLWKGRTHIATGPVYVQSHVNELARSQSDTFLRVIVNGSDGHAHAPLVVIISISVPVIVAGFIQVPGSAEIISIRDGRRPVARAHAIPQLFIIHQPVNGEEYRVAVDAAFDLVTPPPIDSDDGPVAVLL